MNYSKDSKEANQKKQNTDQQGKGLLSVERIKSLLANPDISPSQKKTLLNLLNRLER